MLPPDTNQWPGSARGGSGQNEHMAGLGDPFMTEACDPKREISLPEDVSSEHELMSIEPSLLQPGLFETQDFFLEHLQGVYPDVSSAQDQQERSKRTRTSGGRRFSAPDGSRRSPSSLESMSDSPVPSGSTSLGRIVPTNEISRRDAHMASEQRRRAVMNDSFERLRQLLPASEYRKPSKANILQATVSYIESLQRSVRNLQNKTQFLARENAILSQQVNGMAVTPMSVAVEAALVTDGKLPLPMPMPAMSVNPNMVAIAPMPDKRAPNK